MTHPVSISTATSVPLQRNHAVSVLYLQRPAVFLIQVLISDEQRELHLFFQQVDLFLSALGHEDTEDSPQCTVEEVSTKHVESAQGLRVVITEDGHELLHTFLGNIVTLGHLSTVVDDAQLVGLWVRSELLAFAASRTPFSIM